MPLCGITVFAGEKGLGKSILTNGHLPAKVTRGQLDGELRGKPADVLIITAEDSWEAVIKPRLMAAGADLDRVHRFQVEDEHGEALVTLPDDVPLLEAAVEKLAERGHVVVMVVVDPIGAFLSGHTDSHRKRTCAGRSRRSPRWRNDAASRSRSSCT